MDTTIPTTETSHSTDTHHGPTGLLGDTTFYVLISFIIFCLLAYKFGRASVTSGLDTKIARIRDELAAAEKTRQEAEALLADVKHREEQAASETARIVAQATEDAAALRDAAALELDADIARREAMLETRLRRMQEDAQASLQATAAALVIQSAEQIVAQAVSEKTHAQLVKATTESLPDTLQRAQNQAA